MTRTARIPVVAACVAMLGFASGAGADDAAVQRVFSRVFGEAVQLDPDVHAKVLAGEPGLRHYLDRDGDGDSDEVWFIDTARRHPESWRPVLVRVIDEDGDLETGHEPDFDSDLYVADWRADGVVDVVCDYTDRDGDNDVDEMGMYFPKGDGLMVWWGDDVGDDNLLWYDVGYTYRQGSCQWRCHFGGNELFCAFSIGETDPEWIPAWENPFLFYDRDLDGVTEEVIRIEGQADIVGKLRHSFDADNDGTPERPHDYDVSVTAHAPEGLTFDERYSERRMLRGIPTGSFLSYAVTPHFCRQTVWAKQMLTWDEIDRNMDRDGRTDTNERWEGVIAKGNEWFKQVGGPSCGPLNNRFELASTADGPIRLYYSPTDQRVHLYGADRMWLDVDADLDQTPEMRYTYLDSDKDGYIDTWQFDADNDGNRDDSWLSGNAATTDLGFNWAQVNAVVQPTLETAPQQLFELDGRLRQALAKLGGNEPDPVWELIDSGFAIETVPVDDRARFLESNETLRFYLDVLKDRLILALKQRHNDAGFWETFGETRQNGDLEGMIRAVEQAFSLEDSVSDFDTWRGAKLAALQTPQVAWGEDWVEPNIGWESEVCAYRAYWGQFDFFGKSGPRLVIDTFGTGINYHQEQDWGIDALHVGETSGIGGVTLYVNGLPYPVRSPNGNGPIAWSKRLVAQTDGRVTVEFAATPVGPKDHAYTVRFQCSAQAGRRDSSIEVTVEGGKEKDAIELGIGLTKLGQESFTLSPDQGIMASWGVQEPAIGVIGMGVIVPPAKWLRYVDLEDEHQVVIAIAHGEPVTYRIQGDWLRGRRFPRSPGINDWLDDLRRTALLP